MSTIARIDKYEPVGGGFRAPLAADLVKTTPGNPLGVGLDVNGRVVLGAGSSGIKGVLSLNKDMKAGDIVDVMTDGEMVAMAGVTAGSNVTADTVTGVLSNTVAGAGAIYVGHCVEATRLIVRVTR